MAKKRGVVCSIRHRGRKHLKNTHPGSIHAPVCHMPHIPQQESICRPLHALFPPPPPSLESCLIHHLSLQVFHFSICSFLAIIFLGRVGGLSKNGALPIGGGIFILGNYWFAFKAIPGQGKLPKTQIQKSSSKMHSRTRELVPQRFAACGLQFFESATITVWGCTRAEPIGCESCVHINSNKDGGALHCLISPATPHTTFPWRVVQSINLEDVSSMRCWQFLVSMMLNSAKPRKHAYSADNQKYHECESHGISSAEVGDLQLRPDISWVSREKNKISG